MAADAPSVAERSARRISPLVFAAAIVGFFLAFAGVSCNTSAAKALLGGTAQSLGGSSSQTAKAGQCLDALNGYNLATYTGIDLAFGGSPSVSTRGPAACEAVNPSSQASTSRPEQGRVGAQPVELIALVAIAVGLLVSGVFVIRSPGSRARALITLLLSAAGLALVVIAQLQAGRVITDRVASASAGAGQSTPIGGINLSDYLNVNPGIGFFITTGALGLTLLLNLFAAALPRSRAPEPPGALGPSEPPQPPPPRNGIP